MTRQPKYAPRVERSESAPTVPAPRPTLRELFPVEEDPVTHREVIPCPFCPFKSTWRQNLRTHGLRIHPIEWTQKPPGTYSARGLSVARAARARSLKFTVAAKQEIAGRQRKRVDSAESAEKEPGP